MTERFQDQGGAASSQLSPLARWLQSKVLTKVIDPARQLKKRKKAEAKRVKAGLPHVVEYFHQVDDGYSHLAAQILRPLAARYDIELICHLVTGPLDKNAPEPDLLLRLSRYDAFHVAPEYGLHFPQHEAPLSPHLCELASSILAAQDAEGFVQYVADVGHAMWVGDESALQALADKLGIAEPAETEAKVAAGTARRTELKHYSGAMLYYGGEWYWGVDRLYHLEQRLAELGADNKAGQSLLMPRPSAVAGDAKDNGSLTLEVYPSLRSPYTAISFDRCVKLAQDTGVKLVVRPVLPMVMRGVPATREKGMYIFLDTAREARAAGVPYDKFYDPIGEPVRRGYSLYPWAVEQGKGVEFLSAFLRAAFVDGVNTLTDKGLQVVVENAGLDWSVAKELIGTPGWEDVLESNRLAMYDAGLWGVPSFRLLDQNGEQVLALWGQDRLWLFARKIQQLLEQR